MDAEKINTYLKKQLEDVAYRNSMENLEFNNDLEALIFKRNKFIWVVPYSQTEYVILKTDQTHESMNNL